MANKEVLNDKLLRARIMELEYDQVTESEVRRIYIEETGQKPPSDITIYHSDDYKEVLRHGDWYSGFDGTVIHFYDEDLEVNQMYTIARGSEPSEKDSWKPKDWVYNLFGIGMDSSIASSNVVVFYKRAFSKCCRVWSHPIQRCLKGY